MRSEHELADLPEAVPLDRVAPFWRLLAILALLGLAGLIFVSLTLGLALVQRTTTGPSPMTAMVPAPMFFPPVAYQAVEDLPPPPYPVKADLDPGDEFEPPVEKQGPAGAPPPSVPYSGRSASGSRQRFLSKGADVWRATDAGLGVVAVSPDGKKMAYVSQGRLWAGPMGQPQEIAGPDIAQTTPGMGGGPIAKSYSSPVPPAAGGGALRFYPKAAMAVGQPALPATAVPSWSRDRELLFCPGGARGLLMFVTPKAWSLDDGTMMQKQLPANVLPGEGALPFAGDWPAAIDPDEESLAFVRSQPVPKLEITGQDAVNDSTEVVQAYLQNRSVRVLVPASKSSWAYLATSPSGDKLALVSDRGHEGPQPRRLRVFLLELKTGKLQPLTPPATQVGPVSWTSDGTALVYARSEEPEPADHWTDGPAGAARAQDLYLWDLKTNQEVRLSRGGGFFSPSVTNLRNTVESRRDGTEPGSDELYYLTEVTDETGPFRILRRMPLKAARDFAAQEPETVRRDLVGWTAVIDRTLAESGITNVDKAEIGPKLIAEVAKNFQRFYRERFKAESPATLKGFVRLRKELSALQLPESVRNRFGLVATAVEVDYLLQKQSARWQINRAAPNPSAAGAESPFGYVLNPLAAARELTPNAGLPSWLRKAEGRTVVFANDPAEAKKALAELEDPDLARGKDLLKQGKADEGEDVLFKMLKQKRHEKNYHLALQVGAALYAHNRNQALRGFMEEQCQQWPPDARKFNLLGLALLDFNPQKAVEAFQKALRCDLRFEPGYLNLAQAYQKVPSSSPAAGSGPVGDFDAASLCLLRYLELMPQGAYAADARQRVAALEQSGK
jgi:hypothetical protein